MNIQAHPITAVLLETWRTTTFYSPHQEWISLKLRFSRTTPHAFYDQTSIAWANGVLDQYPNRRTILMTHDFYDNRGLVADIIKKHDNLFMAICGHTCALESY